MTRPSAIHGDLGSAVSVLSLSPIEDDHSSLEGIFSHSKWRLHKADRLSSALRILEEHEVGVILCEQEMPPVTWREVSERVRAIPHSPPLIVTSRLADERLWGEALNQGVYDVLAKPFDRGEVVRSVSLAWLHWLRQRVEAAGARKVMRAAS